MNRPAWQGFVLGLLAMAAIAAPALYLLHPKALPPSPKTGSDLSFANTVSTGSDLPSASTMGSDLRSAQPNEGLTPSGKGEGLTPPSPKREGLTPPSPHGQMGPGNEEGLTPPIHITLSLDQAATVSSGVVYVIARPDGEAKGHPIAVRRLVAMSFPVTVDLGGPDSMMGQPLPAKVHVEARLDTDGDAGTKDPADPHASLDQVSAGSTIALTLR